MHPLRTTQGTAVIPAALDWLTRLTAYGWIDLGCDLTTVAGVAVGLRRLTHIRADTRQLLHSETYGHHAKKRGPA